MGAALAFAAVMRCLAERDAKLDGDDPSETNEQAAGEVLGVFTTDSPWPILIALCTLALFTGMLWSPLLGLRACGNVLCFWRLGAESARTRSV